MKKLNFTFEKLAETSQKLDAFRGMVRDLEKAEAKKPSKRAKKLAYSVISSFQSNMDNDLNVKNAFDKLFQTVLQLHKLMKQGKVSAKDAEAALSELHRVDCVLQVIF
jgi:cysteinyl-tRNA synthetase